MASDFQSFLEDLFAPLGGVRLRRMFGGIGIFREGTMFALVVDDVLYMKTDGATAAAYAAEGSAPWVYQGTHRASKPTAYWRLPERLYDEPEEFRDWALAAIGVAERARTEPGRSKKPASRKGSATRSRP